MQQDVGSLLSARHGHFILESGHHGDLWLDLELLCLRPGPVRRLAIELAKRLRSHQVDAVCGPLVEGAFVGLMVASEIDVEFSYSERIDHSKNDALYPIEYRIPANLRPRLCGARVAIVNDVINAGSAVRGTYSDLKACGAVPVVISALLVLGTSALQFAEDESLALETIASLPNSIWPPSECPLCAGRIPFGERSGLDNDVALAHELTETTRGA
jgi:orotate phosphoribosyltransferase